MGCSSSSAQTVEQEKRPGTKPEESNGDTQGEQSWRCLKCLSWWWRAGVTACTDMCTARGSAEGREVFRYTVCFFTLLFYSVPKCFMGRIIYDPRLFFKAVAVFSSSCPSTQSIELVYCLSDLWDPVPVLTKVRKLVTQLQPGARVATKQVWSA